MFPEPTELLLIGYSIESIWTPKIQIKYIDTKNQHTWRVESSFVFISVLQIVLKWCRKEHKKIQVKKES